MNCPKCKKSAEERGFNYWACPFCSYMWMDNGVKPMNNIESIDSEEKVNVMKNKEDLTAITAVLEQELLEALKNKVNATIYLEAKILFKELGLPEDYVCRMAARLALRIKKAMQEI